MISLCLETLSIEFLTLTETFIFIINIMQMKYKQNKMGLNQKSAPNPWSTEREL